MPFLLGNATQRSLFRCLGGVVVLEAGVAQLVEHNLAKVGVAGSNPVFRFSS